MNQDRILNEILDEIMHSNENLTANYAKEFAQETAVSIEFCKLNKEYCVLLNKSIEFYNDHADSLLEDLKKLIKTKKEKSKYIFLFVFF